MNEPFAVEIYRRLLAGETVFEISQESGIPAERIETRIRAALGYLAEHPYTAGGGQRYDVQLVWRNRPAPCSRREPR